MPHEVVFSARAREQLARMEAYIARAGYPQNARRYVAALEKRCLDIGLAPHQGTRRDDLKPGVRTTGFRGNVTILFDFDGVRVRILSLAAKGKQLGLR